MHWFRHLLSPKRGIRRADALNLPHRFGAVKQGRASLKNARLRATVLTLVTGATSGEKGDPMVTAICLIQAKREMVEETAQQLVKLEGVTEVYSVAGQYDLVAILRTPANEDMADLITGSMLRLVGIERTTTLLAFKSYSEYDLDRMFGVGRETED
jgi:DNA-binding Lrp family transcriptional regulator